MRLIDETAYQDKLAKIPMGERFFVKAVETAQHMPTIDPVKHGRWIDGTSFGGVRCSECGYGAIIMLHYSSSFCPNCGCDMSGGNNGKE